MKFKHVPRIGMRKVKSAIGVFSAWIVNNFICSRKENANKADKTTIQKEEDL